MDERMNGAIVSSAKRSVKQAIRHQQPLKTYELLGKLKAKRRLLNVVIEYVEFQKDGNGLTTLIREIENLAR